VNHLKEFNIRFRGLSVGFHDYNWKIHKEFFDALENTDIEDSDLVVELNLEKQDRMMIFNFSITGELKVLCDRCLDELNIPVALKETFYIKFGSVRVEESEDVLVIPESEYQFDVSLLINEYVTLSLPFKKVHTPDAEGNYGCNEQVIKRLQELSVNKMIDPRWEKLKNIKLE
jgi:uncharacterized metal-binding protein YceD (DUF177 family)